MKRSTIQGLLLNEPGECQAAAAFWILVLTVTVVPLALAPGLQFLEITPKLLLLVMGACLVSLALVAGNYFPAPRQEHALYFSLLGGLALLNVLATVFSSDPVLSLVGSEGRRLGLVASLACLGLAAAVPVLMGTGLRRRRRLPAAMVLAALVAAAYGFGQYLGFDPWIRAELYRMGAGQEQIVRPPSTFGHANYFAVVSLLAMFLASGLALSGSTRRARLGWSAAAVILALALVISASRGAWLGAGASLAVLYPRVSRRRPLLAGLLAVALLALALVVSPWGQQVRNRVRSFPDDPGVTARLLVWKDSLRLLAAHPLLGTGPDTYELVFPRYQSTRLAEHAPDHYAESPHNVLLDHLITTGIPAGLIFVALIAVAIRKYAISSRTAALEAGLLAALVGGLVAMQFSGDTISTRLALFMVIALSLSTPAEPRRFRARGLIGTVAIASLVLLILFGSRLIRADRALLLANRAASRGQIESALREGQRAPQAFPWMGTHPFAFSRLAAQLAVNPGVPLAQRSQLLSVAEESARAGLLHSSQPQVVFVHLASLQVLQGRQGEAQASLLSAVEAAPVWYRPRWLLAVLLADQGQLRQAAEQAEAALQMGARQHPEIAATCLRIRQLAPQGGIPEPGQFEFPQPVSNDRYDLCGGRIVLDPELMLRRSPNSVLSPGQKGAWDGVAVSNPSLAERQGELLMWYSGFDGRFWRTGLARSQEGNRWQKSAKPVLEPTVFGWVAGSITARGTILYENARFYQWFQAGRSPRIGWATSSDGETWTTHPGPALEPGLEGAWDSAGVADPFVLRCGETLFLFYVGHDAEQTPRLGVASSRDGIHWAKYPANPVLDLGPLGSFDERGASDPAVVPISRGLALFYSGRDAQHLSRIGLALSPDGIHWQKIGVALDVSKTGWDSRGVNTPHVSVSRDQLRLWFGGIAGEREGSEPSQIGLATARVEEGVHLFYDHAVLHPRNARADTPNGRWAFPYKENSLVTLPQSDLTFVVDIPARARFRATVQMPLEGADPAWGVVRVNGQPLFSELIRRPVEINLDLNRFAHQRVELQLAAAPTPQGQHASWVQWLAPRVVAEATH